MSKRRSPLTFEEENWDEHKRWMAFERNSMTWPKYWRATIYRINRLLNPDGTQQYVVHPRNPEYQKYIDAEYGIDMMVVPPTPYLDPVTFDSVDDIDTWAQVVWRMK